MNRSWVPVRWDQRNIALLVNSGSVVHNDGLWTPPLEIQLIEWPTDPSTGDRKVHDLAQAFPPQSSITLSTRNRRPVANGSDTKSTYHR